MTAFDPRVAARIAESQIPMSADYVQDAGRLSPQRETEIRTRVEAATEGPWQFDPEGVLGSDTAVTEVGGYERIVGSLYFGDGEDAAADRTFIIHARQDVDLLLAELDRERARSERIKQRLLLGGGEWCKRALAAEAELDRIRADVQGLALGDIKPGTEAAS